MVNDVNEAGFPPAPRSFQRAANLTSAHLLSGGLLSPCLVAVLGSLDFSDKLYQCRRERSGGRIARIVIFSRLALAALRTPMVIGERLRKLRKSKNLSQGDIETRTGMLRAYISRVENGHTIPTIESLEKLAQAFKVPLYKLFYDGKVSASIRTWKRPSSEEWGDREADATYLRHLSKLLARMTPNQRNLLMHVAQKISRRG